MRVRSDRCCEPSTKNRHHYFVMGRRSNPRNPLTSVASTVARHQRSIDIATLRERFLEAGLMSSEIPLCGVRDETEHFSRTKALDAHAASATRW